MAVGFRLTFPGGTQEQYVAVHDRLDIESRPPHGLIFHSSGPIEGGWSVFDVWHNRNDFDQFARDRLMPAVAELGDRAFPEPPDIEVFPVHNYMTRPL